MLNLVALDGYVTRKIWRVDEEIHFRLAVYRDPDRPPKEAQNGNGVDAPDYFTIRLPAGLTALIGRLEAGQRVQVYGWLESRHYEETLAEFLERAKVDGIKGVNPDEVVVSRTTTWVVAERLVPINNGKSRR